MSGVDVIIPCYNYAHFLRDCVGSVLSQAGVSLRVLIIDDASTDNSADLAAELAAADPRVQFRRHSVNVRNIATYNEGLAWATAPYTLLISADDMLLPGALLRATRLLDLHPDVGMAYGRIIQHRDGDPLPRAKNAGNECGWRIVPGELWLADLCANCGNGIASPEVVVRTRVQHEIGGYCEQLPHSGDIELWTRFALSGPIGILDADQAIYRVHRANMHLHRDGFTSLLLQDRWNAFRTAFEWAAAREYRRPRLENLARRTLSRAAIWAASRSFDEDCEDPRTIQDLVRFATGIHPMTRVTRAYLGLQLRLKFGKRLWKLLSQLRGGTAAPTTSTGEA